ncbi:hypothetical protein FQA39_LY15337 [Lamprigera yunnana]|nr:hypothetical protein FQA39_LY15337 [Lamprigera yunnana]
MRVFCSGFNLYGQFIKCRTLIIEKFIDYTCDETWMVPAHTFNLLITPEDKVMYMHGSKKGQTHETQKITLHFVVKQLECVDSKIICISDVNELIRYEENGEFVLIAKNIVKVACGAKINVALTDDGKLLNLPHELQFQNFNLKDVVTGCEHCLLLDDLGKVYTFGCGSRGQLGHGNLEDEYEPKVVEALEGIKIKKIAAGGWHSCAISAEGDLYIWGWNGNGQLGLYNDESTSIAVMAAPKVVDFEDDINVNVLKAACGYRHTIVLLDNGKMYGTGWNKYHQLGNIESTENVYKMVFLYDFKSETVQTLKCGPWSSIVIVK